MYIHVLQCFICLHPDVDFNVSGAFVAIPAINSNNLSQLGNEYDSGTLERKRPISMAVMEGDLLKKEGYV